MKYILFIFIFSSDGSFVHTYAFNSESACRTAALSVDTARMQRSWREGVVQAFCVSDTKEAK